MSLRGVVEGEIRDRTHLFSVIGYFILLFGVSALPLFSGFKMLNNAPSNLWYHNTGENPQVRGAILFSAGLFIFFLLLFFISKELTFIRISRESVRINRPLLWLFPFSKQKAIVEFSLQEFGELKIETLPRGTRWHFLDKNGNGLLKMNFNSGNNFTAEEWKTVLAQTNIPLKISWEYYWNKQ